MDISKIQFNGVEYQIKDKEAQILIDKLLGRIDELEELTKPVKELDSFSDGDIFIGAITVEVGDDGKMPTTYEYLTSILDGESCQSFANTDKPITVRYNWKWGEKVGDLIKSFFILIPENHKSLYSLEGEGARLSEWDNILEYVDIDFPTGTKRYKYYYIYGSAANFNDTELTYKF